MTNSGYNWDYQPPKHLHEQIKPHLDAHFESYRATGRVGKHNGPPYLFLSRAGTRKSRSANEFHRTLIECSKELENEELERRLRGAMVFHVDLENGTSPREDEMGNPIGLIGYCESLSPTARWALSLPPGHSQKPQIDDWWVIDLSVLYSLSGPRS